MAATVGPQSNVVANESRKLIFFGEAGVCYNYGTDQWTEVSAYDDEVLFSINRKTSDIGIVRFSASGSVEIQEQTVDDFVADANITTTAGGLVPFGRAIVNAVRLLYRGDAIPTIRIGVQDDIDDNPTWKATSTQSARTLQAFARAEGRYHRFEVQVTLNDPFDQIMGIDIDYTPQGRV